MSWTFHPPPGWPVPSGDWVPPPGWTPDPDWPPAPPGWEFWVYVDAPPAPSHPPLPARRRRRPAMMIAALAGIILLATGTGGLVAYLRDPLPEGVRELYSAKYQVGALAAAHVHGDPVVVLHDSAVPRSEEDMRVLDLATGEPLRAFEDPEAWSLVTGRVSGRPVAVTDGRDHTMHVWDLATGERLRELAGHTGEITSVAVGDLAGTPIAASTSVYDHTLRIWDLTTGEPLHELYGGRDERVDGEALAVAEVGGRTLIAVSASGSVTGGTNRYGLDVWSITAGEEPQYEQRLSCPYAMSEAPSTVAIGTRDDGTPVAVSGCDRAVLWDITTGREIAQLDADLGEPEVTALTALRGTPIAVIGMVHDPLLAWDLDDPDRFHEPDIGHSGSVRSLAVTALDGETVVVSGDTHGRVHVWPPELTGLTP